MVSEITRHIKYDNYLYLNLTPAMCGAEPQAEHPSEQSERHDGLVSCFIKGLQNHTQLLDFPQFLLLLYM